jgi:hypothetical protein
MILGLVFALIIRAPQQDSRSTESQATMKQQAHDEYERHKQSAIRINELAQRIHSEADASAVVSEIAGLFAKELPPAWSSGSIRQRVAHAEYESVRNPVTLIPEQRIVDVWNQYVKEIGAPDEAIVSLAEIHNMRDGSFTFAQLMWARGNQTIWTIPNVFALAPDGRVAYSCRALDAIRVIHDLESLFQNLPERVAASEGNCAVRRDQEAGGRPKRAATRTPFGWKRTPTQIPFAPLNNARCRSMAQWHTTSCSHACLTHCFHASESTTAKHSR